MLGQAGCKPAPATKFFVGLFPGTSVTVCAGDTFLRRKDPIIAPFTLLPCYPVAKS